MKTLKELTTTVKPNWCPGCFNFQILAGVKNFLDKEISNGKKKEDFAMVTGIGCHGKIYDSYARFVKTEHCCP